MPRPQFNGGIGPFTRSVVHGMVRVGQVKYDDAVGPLHIIVSRLQVNDKDKVRDNVQLLLLFE